MFQHICGVSGGQNGTASRNVRIIAADPDPAGDRLYADFIIISYNTGKRKVHHTSSAFCIKSQRRFVHYAADT